MAAYSYSAINAEGFQLTGEVHAPDLDAAREQLRIRGLLAEFMEELPASGEDGVRTVFKKIKPKTLQIFSRQFATMIEAGLNVVSSLVILEEQTDDPYFALVIKEIREQAADPQLLARGFEVGCVDLAGELEAVRIDRAVRVCRHTKVVSAG